MNVFGDIVSLWEDMASRRLEFVKRRRRSIWDRFRRRSNAERWELLWKMYRDFQSEVQPNPIRALREFDRLIFESVHIDTVRQLYGSELEGEVSIEETNAFIARFRGHSPHARLREKHYNRFKVSGPLCARKFAAERRRLDEFVGLLVQFGSFGEIRRHLRVARVHRFRGLNWSNSHKVAVYRCWREACVMEEDGPTPFWFSRDFSYAEAKGLLDQTRSYRAAREAALREVIRIVFCFSSSVAVERNARTLVGRFQKFAPRVGSDSEMIFSKLLNQGDGVMRAALLGRLVGLKIHREPRLADDPIDSNGAMAISEDAMVAEGILEHSFHSMDERARRAYELMRDGVRFHDRVFPGLDVWLLDNLPVFGAYQFGWKEVFLAVQDQFFAYPNSPSALRKWSSGRGIQLGLARGAGRIPDDELRETRAIGRKLLSPVPAFSRAGRA